MSREHIHKIIDIELKSLFGRIEALGHSIQLTDEAKDYIAEKGFDTNFGARPLKRAIQKYMEDPIEEELLKGELKSKALLVVDLDAETNEIVVKGENPDNDDSVSTDINEEKEK